MKQQPQAAPSNAGIAKRASSYPIAAMTRSVTAVDLARRSIQRKVRGGELRPDTWVSNDINP
jgi:hypothetical protein